MNTKTLSGSQSASEVKRVDGDFRARFLEDVINIKIGDCRLYSRLVEATGDIMEQMLACTER